MYYWFKTCLLPVVFTAGSLLIGFTQIPSFSYRSWSTFLGGTEDDNIRDMTIDAQGNVYTVGTTSSPSGITTTGVHQSVFGGGRDAYLSKFNTDGVLLWSTYFGGSDNENGQHVQVDAQGRVYITGETSSATGISSVGAHQSTFGGGSRDAYVAVFSPSGTLLWATYLGGSMLDVANALTVDAQGAIYVTGWSESSDGIATTGAFQPTFSSQQDAFIVKFNSDGTRAWGTYLGDTGLDTGLQIEIAPNGTIITCGWTSSTSNIATPGAFQTSYAGGTSDCYLAAFSPAGARLWCTYYGGSIDEYGDALAIDSQGRIYVAGPCNSPDGLATTGTHQTNLIGGYESFLAAFTPTGQRRWGTYQGGPGDEAGYGLAIGPGDFVYFTGFTQSDDAWIATPLLPQETRGGDWDAFFTKFDSTGQRYWSSFWGGTANDRSYAIEVGSDEFIYMAGLSGGANFPIRNAHQLTYGGGAEDGFVTKIAPCGIPVLSILNGGDVCRTDTVRLNMEFKGFGLFNLRYAIDGVEQAPIQTIDTTYTLRIPASRVQDSVQILGLNLGICPAILPGLPYAHVRDSLQAGAPVIACNNANLTYTVSFPVQGDFKQLVAIAPTQATISGNQYTSAPLPFGTNYDIQLTSDVACDTLQLRGTSGCVQPCFPRNIPVVSNSPLCEGQNLQLSTSATGTRFRWSGPNGFTANGASMNIPNVSTTNSGLFRLQVEDGVGCTDTASITIAVQQPPRVQLPDSVFCVGDSIRLRPVSPANDWQYALGSTLNFQSNTRFPPLAAGTYNVLVRNNFQCIDTLVIRVSIAPVINAIGIDSITCSKPLADIEIRTEPENSNFQYQLNNNPPQTAPRFNFVAPGIYSIAVVDANGCRNTSQVSIPALKNTLQIDAVDTKATTCRQSNGQAEVKTSNSFGTVFHTLSDGKEQPNGVFTDLAGGEYRVFVRDERGCRDTTAFIITSAACDVFVPNAFSPNGDGSNDTFEPALPQGEAGIINQFRVFDRWGEVVFQITNIPATALPGNGWDGTFRGKDASAGSYIYLLKVDWADGSTLSKSGELVLIR